MTSISLEQVLVGKLSALQRLGSITGMFGRFHLITGINAQELESRRSTPLATPYIKGAISVLLDSDAHHIQHAAAGVLLQYYWPKWQEEGPPELVGHHITRDAPAVLSWRKRVLKRDNWRCMHCGASSNLHVHHIVQWVDAPSLRTVDANGITLCQPCHIEEHATL